MEELFFTKKRGGVAGGNDSIASSRDLSTFIHGPPGCGHRSLIFQYAFRVASEGRRAVVLCSRDAIERSLPVPVLTVDKTMQACLASDTLSEGGNGGGNGNGGGGQSPPSSTALFWDAQALQRIDMKYVENDKDLRSYVCNIQLAEPKDRPDVILVDRLSNLIVTGMDPPGGGSGSGRPFNSSSSDFVEGFTPGTPGLASAADEATASPPRQCTLSMYDVNCCDRLLRSLALLLDTAEFITAERRPAANSTVPPPPPCHVVIADFPQHLQVLAVYRRWLPRVIEVTRQPDGMAQAVDMVISPATQVSHESAAGYRRGSGIGRGSQGDGVNGIHPAFEAAAAAEGLFVSFRHVPHQLTDASVSGGGHGSCIRCEAVRKDADVVWTRGNA